MMKRLAAVKAEAMFSVARFIATKHENIFLDQLARTLAWFNRNSHGKDTLDFLEEEDSIDHLDYEAIDEQRDSQV